MGVKRFVVKNITKRQIKDNYLTFYKLIRKHGIRKVTEFAPPFWFKPRKHWDVEYEGIGLFGPNVHIKHDLDKSPYPIKTNSTDLVIMSHILEHMRFPKVVVDEAKRVSKRYIMISLPNEMNLRQRIYMLFGRSPIDSDFRYGHRYFLHSGNLKTFVEDFCGLKDWKLVALKYCYGSHEGKFMIRPLRFWFSRLYPSLLAHHWIFLYESPSKPAKAKNR